MSETLRLGVTGHRLLVEEGKLRAAVGEALDTLTQRCPDHSLVVYSALAEGADRLVAEMALDRFGASLVAVLPFSVSKYLDDFEAAASRKQFAHLLGRAAETVVLPNSHSKTEAYWQAGRYVVDHVDVLLALWDGQPGQGKSGTADVIAYARHYARPMMWIRAGNREPGTNIPATLGPDQGRLTTENLE